MRRVIVESPYAGNLQQNTKYARACLADCLARDESPFASHLLYTQPGVLRDKEPAERELGIKAGFAWGAVANAVVVYTDRGVSEGMRLGIQRAQFRGQIIEYRTLGNQWKLKGDKRA